MKKTKKPTKLRWPKRLRKSLWVLPGLGLLTKVIIVTQIPGNGWLGADGENYLKGLDFLINEGFLSQESILHYWPAGYPLLMWVLAAFNHQVTLPLMAIVQSTLYAFATAYFSQKLNETTLRRYALPVALILTISPTLALNTIAIGYELISASTFLIALGLFISLWQVEKRKFWDWRIIVIGLMFSLNNFVQPRFLLSSLIFFLLLSLFLFRKQTLPLIVSLGMILSFLLPSIMIARNYLANDFAAISTNLGVTMRIGAGDGATGGYVPSFAGVTCPATEGNAAEVDQLLVRCTINWYLDNPTEILRLGINKSIYFWSPWFGPLANGSMARNPWLQINPVYDIATESQEGYDLIFGPLGKAFSWAWFFLYLATAGFGAFKLWRHSQIGKHLSLLVLSLVLANWLISLGTLGDHRQRLPIMSMVIFLQVVGIMNLKDFTGRNRKAIKSRK